MVLYKIEKINCANVWNKLFGKHLANGFTDICQWFREIFGKHLGTKHWGCQLVGKTFDNVLISQMFYTIVLWKYAYNILKYITRKKLT